MLTVVQLPALVKTWEGDNQSLQCAVRVVQAKSTAREEAIRANILLAREQRKSKVLFWAALFFCAAAAVEAFVIWGKA